jgi:hypothetical protein
MVLEPHPAIASGWSASRKLSETGAWPCGPLVGEVGRNGFFPE